MKIFYVENKNGKLFSFFRRDFKENKDEDGQYIMIDGGFDYHRHISTLHEGEIKDLMPEIRKQFKWGINYNEKNELLPKTIYTTLDLLTTSHIIGILRYFTEKMEIDKPISLEWKAIHLIFCYELENRLKK